MTENEEKKLGNLFGCTGGNYAGNVYDKNYISPTILTAQGGQRQPMIIEYVSNKDEKNKYYACASRGRNPDKENCNNGGVRQQRLEINWSEYSNAITSVNKDCYILEISEIVNMEKSKNKGRYRIRKLTPRECAVLMGLTFEDDDKMAEIGISNSARYRCYGNGIITNCIELLFEHLYKAQYDQSFECYDENFTRAVTV